MQSLTPTLLLHDGGRSFGLSRKPGTARGRSYACFLFGDRDILAKQTVLSEWMKLSKGGLNKCISIVSSLHSVNLRALQTLFLELTIFGPVL